MARILIVEDEVEMGKGLKDAMEFEGYETETANDGETGLEFALNGNFDLIVLDLMLPRKSGFDVCREIRNRKINVPILMVTARGEEIDKVLGLELGADDYITKPFSLRELLARVKALLRRYLDSERSLADRTTIGSITVDFEHYSVTDSRGKVEFTIKEFDILKYLVQHHGETVSREKLMESVWGYDEAPTSRTVDNHILRLRKKIESDPANPVHILTVHGIGYKYIN